MASAGQVAQRTQAAWEKGEQTPNAEYLGQVSLGGADVLYIVTGKHAWQATGAELEAFLSAEDREVLWRYRAAEGPVRDALKTLLAALHSQDGGQ